MTLNFLFHPRLEMNHITSKEAQPWTISIYKGVNLEQRPSKQREIIKVLSILLKILDFLTLLSKTLRANSARN
jgi:hypothetical protein